MKKRIALLSIVAVLSVIMFARCAAEAPALEAVVKNSPISGVAVSFAETEFATYYIEDNIYAENESIVNKFISQSEVILAEIDAGRLSKKPSFAIKSDGSVQNPMMNETVFLSLTELENSDAISMIFEQNMLNLWMQKGMAIYLSSGAPKLREEDMDFSLLDFDGKFYVKEYNTPEDIKKRSILSASFIAFIDKTYGRDKLTQLFYEEITPQEIFNKSLTEIRDEWIQNLSLGIDVSVLSPASEYLYQTRVEKGIRNVYIQTFDSIYFSVDIKSLKSTDELNYLFLNSFEAQSIVKEFFIKFQVHNKIARINVTMNGLTYAGIEGINFNLSNGLSDNFISILVHEFTHYYINPIYFHGSVFSVRGTVQSEGLAEYVQRKASQSVFDKEFSFIKTILVNHEESITYQTFDKLNVWNEASINAIVFLDMRAILTILETDPSGYYIFPSAYKNGEEVSGIPNSYEQSASYVGYLVETYGMENFLSVYDDIYEYSAIYGKTYDDMVAEWLEYLENSYCVEFETEN